MDVFTLIEKSVHVWWCNILIVHLCGDHITSSNRAPGLGGIKPYGFNPFPAACAWGHTAFGACS